VELTDEGSGGVVAADAIRVVLLEEQQQPGAAGLLPSEAEGQEEGEPAGLDVVVMPAAGAAPLEVVLLAVGEVGEERCVWDLGDGTSGEGPVVAHTYWSPGTYTITLTAGGKTSRATAAVADSPGD